MLLSQSFTAHTHESCQQKASPERMLEVWDLMLLKDILVHPIVHIFLPFHYWGEPTYSHFSTGAPKPILLCLPKDIIPGINSSIINCDYDT